MALRHLNRDEIDERQGFSNYTTGIGTSARTDLPMPEPNRSWEPPYALTQGSQLPPESSRFLFLNTAIKALSRQSFFLESGIPLMKQF
jgi:hypothetical protein